MIILIGAMGTLKPNSTVSIKKLCQNKELRHCLLSIVWWGEGTPVEQETAKIQDPRLEGSSMDKDQKWLV